MIRIDDPLYQYYQWFKEAQRNATPWNNIIVQFQHALWAYHQTHRRSFIWREAITPYNVVVSEIMLQQTQTSRVALKFPQFIDRFPDFKTLATATTQELLEQWVGLGYNRRAFALQETARKIYFEYDNKVPDDPSILITCKGIGPATAASIVTFAYNKPTIFIETNIRSVFLHIFFHGQENVPDSLLLPLIAQSVDTIHPREWYYALMDYGVYIKKRYPNPNKKSSHYNQQSRFEGSDRQIRGAIIRLLTKKKTVSLEEIYTLFAHKKDNIERIIQKMVHEKLVVKENCDIHF